MGLRAQQVVVPPHVDELLTQIVAEQLGSSDPVHILDAGCGRMWSWDLGDLPFHLTGIDSDADALRLRVEQREDLDEWIVGDLRTVDLEPDHYDLVHSAYVLEHVAGAEAVLDRMLDALRPGGLMVIKIPDGHSVYGFITRHTPHWLHVQYKRRVRGKPLAGTPGHGPYPVVYDDVISLHGVAEWARDRDVPLLAAYGDNSHVRFFGRAERVADAALHLVALASLGRLTARYSNLAIVLRKPSPVPTAEPSG